jgi:phosphotriesterase-related protein
MTVSGPIEFTDQGYILEHEHLLVDFIGAAETGYHRWNRDSVIVKVLPYLKQVRVNGVKLFFDATPAYLGRDPVLLKQLSELSGLSIITNTGYYGARNNIFLPEHVIHESAEALAQRWIAEWENGIENTGIKPGFIKISVDKSDTLSQIHQKIVQAAAMTHLKTGLTIASHTGSDGAAKSQIEILEGEGVAPNAFVWIHAQKGTAEMQYHLAKMGVWISLDNAKDDTVVINKYVQHLSNFKNKGLLNKVLISHDAGWYRVGEPKGGQFRDFNAIFTRLIPALHQNGFTDQEIDQLLKHNAINAYQIRKRYAISKK